MKYCEIINNDSIMNKNVLSDVILKLLKTYSPNYPTDL